MSTPPTTRSGIEAGQVKDLGLEPMNVDREGERPGGLACPLERRLRDPVLR